MIMKPKYGLNNEIKPTNNSANNDFINPNDIFKETRNLTARKEKDNYFPLIIIAGIFLLIIIVIVISIIK